MPNLITVIVGHREADQWIFVLCMTFKALPYLRFRIYLLALQFPEIPGYECMRKSVTTIFYPENILM
jgi:hypothetical protein